jgi:hypothetical protein
MRRTKKPPARAGGFGQSAKRYLSSYHNAGLSVRRAKLIHANALGGGPLLREAVNELQQQERNGRRWRLRDVLQPFHETAGNDFPIVLSLVNEQGQPVSSDLSPDTMMNILAPVFTAPA